jgi:hypothetical protein
MLFAPLAPTLTAAPLAPLPVAAPPAPAAVRRPSFGWRARQFRKNLLDGSYAIPLLAKLARRLGLMVGYGELRGRVLHADGTVTDLGLLGRRVVTDAGVTYLAADFAGGANDCNLFKFHGFGVGTTAESASQTALVTEETTQYATDNTRPTGSQSSSTNTYTTVATYSPDSGGTRAITEHGLFSQAATGGGTMWDRTVFSAVNIVASSDSLQATYILTLPSGG